MTVSDRKPTAAGDESGAPSTGDRPLCFVLMPFGRKAEAGGGVLDFDAVYQTLIKPAIVEAGLQPLRADEEQTGGIIHKPMFERLILCEYAVADLTTANANVYYELGVRHAVRPRTTVLVFAQATRLPFDLGPMRGMPYELDASGSPANCAQTRAQLTTLLREARQPSTDSPIFQLVEGMQPPDISRLKTDVFRSRVLYSTRLKDELARGRREGVEAIRAVKQQLGPIRDVEAGVVIDLFLSFRSVKAWGEMIAMVDEMAEPVARTVMVREQLGLALNRAGQGERAELVLLQLLKERGPSSETFGILGRVYKDRWEGAQQAGQAALAAGLLDKAIDAYVKGFQTDWRDAYPGVNAVTLMEVRESPDERRHELIAVVTYSVRRRVASGEPDYWDHATLLELAVLGRNEPEARSALGHALAALREGWEAETTVRNLRLISAARSRRNEDLPWTEELTRALDESAHRLPGGRS